MYHYHHGVSLEMMLPIIQRECGVFMSNAQYIVLCSLPPSTISILYNNRSNLAQLMLFNNSAFNSLLRLSPANLELFFNTTNFGAWNNIDVQLQALLLAQSRSTSVVVVHNHGAPSFPSYRPPHVTGVHTTMFHAPQHAHVQHRPASGHPYGHPHGDMGGHAGGFSMGPHSGGHAHGHR